MLLNHKSPNEEEKKKWKEQLKSTVQYLHENDIVWGDAHPKNVMIDSRTNDLTLIDFEGGCSPGFVDDDKRDTKAGDTQAVQRICEVIDDRKVLHAIYKRLGYF